MEERFCGACGADLPALVRQRKEQIVAALADAEQLASAGKYIEAVTHLSTVEQLDHSQLRQPLRDVAERIQHYPQMRERAVADAFAAAEEARAMLAAQRVDAAHARLSGVPPALKSEQIKRLADETSALFTEARRLRAFIAAAVRDKKYDGLLPLVERLSELNLDDSKAAALLERLRSIRAQADQRTTSELVSLARNALAKCDYSKALSLVNRIPLTELTGEVEALAKHVRERAWLFDRLLTEPHISRTLVSAAERLAKLQPSDGRVGKLVNDLNRRCNEYQQASDNGRRGWAKPPETTALNLEVDLASIPDELAASQPGKGDRAASLITAYGLALQAAGRARYTVNLFPDQKTGSWFSRVGGIRPRKASACWGIDVGASALKAVQVSTEGERPSVLQSFVMPYVTPKAASEDVSRLRTDALAAFMNQHDLSGSSIAINLPGTHTLGRFFDMPAPRRGKFDEALKFELRARMPLGEKQCVFDYESAELDATKDAAAKRRVMLVAGSREHLYRVVQPWQNCGAAQIVVQSECLALANGLLLPTTAPPTSVAYLELGAQAANLVAFTADGIWFRGLYAGLSSFDSAITRGLNLTHAQAELLRRQPERATLMHELYELLKDEFARLTESIRRGLDQLRHETKLPPTRLLLCGGGANQFGLLRYFRLGR